MKIWIGLSVKCCFIPPSERKELDMNNDSEYIYLNFSAFENEILKCNKPVIVEFGAEWRQLPNHETDFKRPFRSLWRSDKNCKAGY